MSLFDIHWLPYHVNSHDREWFAELGCPFVKIVWQGPQPPYSEDIPAGATYVYRDYAAEANRGRMTTDPEGYAREHAEAMRQAFNYLRGRGLPPEHILVEALNEPNIWSEGESPDKLTRYTVEFLRQVHSWGGHAVICNLGVGWPDNAGPDTDPVWDWFKPAIDAMTPGDYLGAHEYWADEGARENWGWWAGRILKCPYHVPILITECGIDLAVKVPGQFNGWLQVLQGTRRQKADRYISEIWDYAGLLAPDNRIQGIMVFTYDADIGGLWAGYDIRGEDIEAAYRAKAAAEPFPQPGHFEWGEQPPEPGEERLGIDISYYQRSGIDWDAFTAAGNDFVMVRLSTGLSLDSAAYGHIDQARYRGIDCGVYHYLTNSYDGPRQARFFAALSDNLDLQLTCAVDVEAAGLTGAFVKAFVDEWRQRTTRPLAIYTSASVWARIAGPGATWAASCPLWVAHYNVEEPALPDVWGDWWMWQYAVKLGPEYPKAIDRDKLRGKDKPPPPPDETFTVTYQPGLPLVVGNYVTVGTLMTLSDPWGNSRSTTAGSKPEWGVGGFELWASTPTDLHQLAAGGQSWPVQMREGQTAVCSWD